VVEFFASAILVLSGKPLANLSFESILCEFLSTFSFSCMQPKVYICLNHIFQLYMSYIIDIVDYWLSAIFCYVI